MLTTGRVSSGDTFIMEVLFIPMCSSFRTQLTHMENIGTFCMCVQMAYLFYRKTAGEEAKCMSSFGIDVDTLVQMWCIVGRTHDHVHVALHSGRVIIMPKAVIQEAYLNICNITASATLSRTTSTTLINNRTFVMSQFQPLYQEQNICNVTTLVASSRTEHL